MSKGADKFMNMNAPNDLRTSWIYDFISLKTAAVVGGLGLTTYGAYNIFRYFSTTKNTKEASEAVEEENLNGVEMISQYMDNLSTSGLKLTKTGRAIVNYGTTCFLNSALQGLSSLPYLIDFICSIECTKKMELEAAIIRELTSILVYLNSDSGNEQGESLHPEVLINLLNQKFKLNGFFEGQQDSHEIMIRLLEILSDIAQDATEKSNSFNVKRHNVIGRFRLM